MTLALGLRAGADDFFLLAADHSLQEVEKCFSSTHFEESAVALQSAGEMPATSVPGVT
jgi:hypothetical protein